MALTRWLWNNQKWSWIELNWNEHRRMSPQASDQNGKREIQSNRKAAVFRVATYNVQSISSSMRLDALMVDSQNYKLDVMGMQETYLKDNFQRFFSEKAILQQHWKANNSIRNGPSIEAWRYPESCEQQDHNTRNRPEEQEGTNSKIALPPLCSSLWRTLKHGKVFLKPSWTLCRKTEIPNENLYWWLQRGNEVG